MTWTSINPLPAKGESEPEVAETSDRNLLQ